MTRGEQIYAYLKDSILKNIIKPKDTIYEKQIAADFQSSITPVREAIKRLATEGFVEISPYRPAVVADASYDKYQKICETLYVLDSYACRKIIGDLTDRDLEELKTMTSEMAEFCSYESVVEYIDRNCRIHIYLWEKLRNDFLKEAMVHSLDSLKHSFLHMIFSQMNLSRTYLRKSLRIHQKLLEVFKERDLSRLNRVVKSHWRITQNSYFR